MQGFSLRTNVSAADDLVRPDDLSREVYGVLGVPVDALDRATLLSKVEAAVDGSAPFLVSTPNVNYLVASRLDQEFLTSMLLSDLCIADGMPLVWIARLLGIPIPERLAGSDLFDTLKAPDRASRQIKVFLFGGADGIAARVAETINAEPGGMRCVGVLNPGFGSVDEMSTDPMIRTINSSGAGLFAICLEAEKAQAWLLKNHHRLQIPVRMNFGATFNFQAGTVKRAPPLLRHSGFEWLWRIKEEPYLWRRYWTDGTTLLHLVLTCVFPLVLTGFWRRLTERRQAEGLAIDTREDHRSVVVYLSGAATAKHTDQAIGVFRDALSREKQILIDLSNTRVIDPRFFGILLMLRKQLMAAGSSLAFTAATSQMKRAFRLNGFDFLLQSEP